MRLHLLHHQGMALVHIPYLLDIGLEVEQLIRLEVMWIFTGSIMT